MKNIAQGDQTRFFRPAPAAQDKAAARETQAEVIAKIAREVLGLDTLETRHSDTSIFRIRPFGNSKPRTPLDWFPAFKRSKSTCMVPGRRVMNVDAMINTNRIQRATPTPGFAIQILRDTDLGIATLIVEDEEGHYEPVNYASSLGEGFEMAQEDLRNRQRQLEADQDPGLCPWEYKVWARGLEGKMVVAATWNVRDL